MHDYFRIRDLTATGNAFSAEIEDDQALLRPLLEVVHVLCERNSFSEDSPVQVTITITRLPQPGGLRIENETEKEE